MATFTMELQDVIEQIFNESPDPEDWIQQYASFTFDGVIYGKLPVVPDALKIGLGSYPIFDESYRSILNGKIIDEYFTREIGTETIDNWTLMIRRKMDQIMPYFNKLYISEQIPYKALDTMMIATKGNSEAKGTQKNTGETTNNGLAHTESRAVSSATPQTMLAGNADYATNATDTNGDSVSEAKTVQDTTQTTVDDVERENLVTGYQAAASDLIVKYRASLLNIDTMVLNEIQDCFMLILNNGDSYTEHAYPYYYGVY